MASPEAQLKPLQGVRIIDLADEKAEYCSKVLADLGADVVKVERPGGDPSRSHGPFSGNLPGPERSLSFWYNNSGKLGITLDLEDHEDKKHFLNLVSTSDAVVESSLPGYLKTLGLDYESLSSINPGLIMASITGFGQTGPNSKYKTSDLVACASGGQMYVTGKPDKTPLKSYGNQSYFLASLFAANGIMLALRWRDLSGKGQHIDISLQEAVAAALEHVLIQYFNEGIVPCRQGALQWNCSSDLFPCRDKFVLLTFNREWETLVELLDQKHMAADLTQAAWRDEEFRKQHIENIQDIFSFWTCMQNSHEVFELGQSMRFPWAIVNSIEDVMENEQLGSRGFFIPAQHPEANNKFNVPGPVICFNGSNDLKWQRPPIAGEHNAMLPQLVIRTASTHPAGAQGNQNSKLPLEGVRVLDFTWMLAGPYATRTLADFGAEVIKVQSRKIATGAEQNDTAYFANWNRNKLSITLDLSRPEARELALDLVKKCDVVIENFTPRVMDNWGLNYDKLKQVNPSLVMVSLSGFGHNGPWRDFAALGPTEHALSGLTDLTAYINGKSCSIGFAYADHISGLYASLAVLSALQLRDSTGTGVHVDISELEATCSLLGPSLIDYSLNGNSVKPVGNGPMWQIAAPHGCYPCKGEDRWCVIAVFSEEEWQSLCSVMGHPAWSREGRFDSVQGRSDSSEELDVLLAGWTAGYAPQDLVKMLQGAGIPAAVVSDASDLAKDPHLAARGFFIDLEHPVLGTIRSDSNPIRLSATPARYEKSAPLLGADNSRVFTELLGMDARTFQTYVEGGIIA
ncbi:MAG: CoA transferase [Chloroflexi bacterium]|nr:CoA transferase [Chloroflexota bacterium]